MASITHAHWWKQPRDQQAASVWAHLDALEQRERLRLARDQVNQLIYSSSVVGGSRASEIVSLMRTAGFQAADLNFVRQIVDALVARIGNNQPAIRVAPDGADWNQRMNGKYLDKLVGGELERLDVAHDAPLNLRASLTSRAGAYKVVAHNGEIVGERVPVDEFRVDSREARYGKPRQLHHLKQVAREVLLRDYPDHADLIETAEPAVRRIAELDEPLSSVGGETNMIDVAESWHLPSQKGADDGVCVMSLRKGVLDTYPWKRQRFPVSFLRSSPPQRGFWSSCLVDELAALQFKVNEVARDLQENVYFTSAVKVLVRRGGNIAKRTVAGKHPHYIEVEELNDVLWKAPDGFSPAQFQFLVWLIQQMYDVSGVSQLMAQSKNPLGANASGAALDNFYDIESERFSQIENDYARHWREIGVCIVDAAADLADDEGFRDRAVSWPNRSVIERVSWGRLDPGSLANGDYELRLEAAGYMPKTRSGKMQAIEQLITNGFLDPVWMPSLLDFPDLEQANMTRSAPVDYALWFMGEVLDCRVNAAGDIDEERSAPMPAPDPDANLPFLKELMKACKLKMIAEKAPHGVIERCIDAVVLVDAALQKAQPPAPPMMGAQASGPPMAASPMAGPAMGAPGPMPMGGPGGPPPGDMMIGMAA